MSGETITVKTRDEHSFEGQLYPAADANAPLLIFLPELGRAARDYAALGKAMASAGVSFVCFDLRGSESSSIRAAANADFGLRVMLEEDLPWAQIALRKRNKHARIWLGGHGLGGQLATLFVARAPAGIEGLILIASGNVQVRHWEGARGAGMLGKLFSKGDPKANSGNAEAKSLVSEWTAISKSGRYRVPGAIFDYESAVPKLRKPVLTLNFTDDKLAPPSAAKALLDQLPDCEKTPWKWSIVETGGVSFDHFSWVQAPETVVPDVGGWILARTPKSDWS